MTKRMVRCTAGEAIADWLGAQWVELDGRQVPLFGGVFAIFGHGNVAGLGEALSVRRDRVRVLRAHNEQAMAHAGIAFAKANNRRRMMACTTSIGPGATNLVTAAATAHVNRLPLLLLPGDVFASRRPDPVLQQLEHFGEPGITANDCLRPVSRYFDRITRTEQLASALPQALRVLTDPAECGPATLALPQDVQTEVAELPAELFEPTVVTFRRPRPDREELARVVRLLRAAERPLVIAGGGVHYALATAELSELALRLGLPVVETQAGKGTLRFDHPRAAGALGVTGSSAANTLAAEADLVLAVGTRLSDFTTASRTLFPGTGAPLIGLNVAPFDAAKHRGVPLVADAREGLLALAEALEGWTAAPAWTRRAEQLAAEWDREVTRVTTAREGVLPSDAEVLGAVNRTAGERGVVVCAAGGLPGELHKLWRSSGPGGYHVEYGYSCMGYEIAGGLGVKLADESREVFVLVGDGSYLMMNSEIATSIMLGLKLTIVVLDNHGFGCIHRLQEACGGDEFNNLLGAAAGGEVPRLDLAAHARALGADAERVEGIAALEAALERARPRTRTSVIVLETDPDRTSGIGGAWWDVAVAEQSERPRVREARARYLDMKKGQQS